MTATKGWGELSEPVSGGGRDIQRLKINDEVRIRIVGQVLPRYTYWVINNEGKRAPLECLSFDRENERWISKEGVDPVKEIDPDILGENGKYAFAYVTNVIDRADGKVKLFDLKSTIYKQILSLAKNPEYGNPADPVSGYDITIKKEKTGPLAMNVKYQCTPGRNSTPLKESELELELYDLNTIFKRPTYEDQKKWLFENTKYFAGDVPQDMNGTDSESMKDI